MPLRFDFRYLILSEPINVRLSGGSKSGENRRIVRYRPESGELRLVITLWGIR